MNGSQFNQLRIFHAIARSGSISSAAKMLEIAPPSVSQSLKLLETSLSLPLFIRTTRRVELTDAGRLLYEQTQQSVLELESALESVGNLSHIPRGTVRITLSRFVYQQILAPVYADFCRLYPSINLETSINDGTVDLIEQGFDLGIRFGDKIADGMVARLLIPPQKDALFASPTYIKEYGKPSSLTSLAQHHHIYYRFHASNQILPLTLNKNGESIVIDAKTALITNDTDLIKDAAIQGLGIGRLLASIVKKEFEEGLLIPILEEYWSNVAGLYIFFPQHAQKAKRVRALIDFLIEKTRFHRTSQ